MTFKNKYVLAIDQGTTSSRAILFNRQGDIISLAQKPFQQYFPKSGWVEHDPNEIWYTQSTVIKEAMAKADLTDEHIACIGIANQRETTIVWDKETGFPVYNAIVWQDRRTSDFCEELKEKGYAEYIQQKTGLVIDAYFSATKIKWILDNVKGVRERAERGELCFGTVDTWLVWKLTRGECFVTDITNASRTMLFNIHQQQWDQELLDLFTIPASLMPKVGSCSEVYAETSSPVFKRNIPISGIAGDQQAALFGQLCIEKGMIKTTYGTGCFMIVNTGEKPVLSQNHLLTTIGWKIGDKVTYALEGSVFVGGAAIQWLRDGIGLIPNASISEQMALSVPDNGGVYFVPALTGLGAPYWDQYARGTIVGITRGTSAAHLTRAALEGICYQVYDVLMAMENDFNAKPKEIRVDGGAIANNFLMQFQADICRCPVVRPKVLETTALGAAYLAGLAVNYWKNIDELKEQWSLDKVFNPEMKEREAGLLLSEWHKAVGSSRVWALPNEQK
ncbi:glycerol kinase [Parabacteroides sp. PF5-5]|uniref:glycerol kinase GlpK n=1 Tax=unclassified Parabacteroides TaxID=2649774 RepID=UPI0024751765|nr:MULTISPECIES: glycerol kinase GlpK [unclassified Parabacteroides]MDH6304293.1 glycerol kinase [Parabacteroides sp. PH5-39]MDH6314992.1 glycerol kinase [Parabacteroides sp. PF5-13]MDH6318652.1 glycerol kinase [Parabacteroides sp. PH5-13]MDH6322382.1 glycerol kinase [Parabacteroides sp. PH5-8]MDH6326483.1 glycerol kinase [Parabacteroides sp. PH5-41]